jgi:hypothetical protein
MLTVTRANVGSFAFERLTREGLVHAVVGDHGLPPDVCATLSLRWLLMEPWVPVHTWATGLAALWLHGCADPPTVVDVMGARGLHRGTPPPGSPQLVFHSGSSEGLLPGPVRTADATRASMDALAHSPARLALPAVYAAIAARKTSRTRLQRAAQTWGHHSRHRARVASLIAAISAT